MIYFGGLCFVNELFLFKNILKDFNIEIKLFDIVAFDIGAIDAIKYAKNLHDSKKRIGKIILLSPVFFDFIYDENEIFNGILIDSKNVDSKNLDKNHLNYLQNCGFNIQKMLINAKYADSKNLSNETLHYSHKNISPALKQMQSQNIEDLQNITFKDIKNHFNFLKYANINEIKKYDFAFDNLDFLKQNSVFTFIGGKDKIIDGAKSFDFFSKYSISFLLKDYNHILKNMEHE